MSNPVDIDAIDALFATYIGVAGNATDAMSIASEWPAVSAELLALRRVRDAAVEERRLSRIQNFEACPDCDYPSDGSKCSRAVGCASINKHAPSKLEAALNAAKEAT
jgi:hypothetical protein